MVGRNKTKRRTSGWGWVGLKFVWLESFENRLIETVKINHAWTTENMVTCYKSKVIRTQLVIPRFALTKG